MDAIEETLQGGHSDDILSTLPPSRVAHLGVPVTVIVAEERSAATAA